MRYHDVQIHDGILCTKDNILSSRRTYKSLLMDPVKAKYMHARMTSLLQFIDMLIKKWIPDGEAELTKSEGELPVKSLY